MLSKTAVGMPSAAAAVAKSGEPSACAAAIRAGRSGATPRSSKEIAAFMIMHDHWQVGAMWVTAQVTAESLTSSSGEV